LVKKLFLDNIGCEYYFTAMVPFVENTMYADIFATETTDVAEVYKDILSVIKPSYSEILGEYGHRRPKLLHGIRVDDSHPLPSEHYEYIKKVLPHLVTEPKDIADQLDEKLSEVWNSDYQGWTYIWPDKKKAKKEKRL
jgi:hypothetical protein